MKQSRAFISWKNTDASGEFELSAVRAGVGVTLIATISNVPNARIYEMPTWLSPKIVQKTEHRIEPVVMGDD
jgi:hypothetical protein